MRWNLILLIVSFVVVLVIALWPIRHPAFTKEENPDPSVSQPVTQNQPLEQDMSLPDLAIAGLVLWTNEQPNVMPSTKLTLQLESAIGRVVVEKRWQDIFHPADRSLQFQFPPTRFGASVHMQLSIVNLPITSVVPLRYQLKDGGAVAYQVRIREPLAVVVLHHFYGLNTDGEDISYMFREGQEIARGHNPYDCALRDKCVDHKSPAYFPLFYWLAAASQKAGFTDYTAWIALWHPVFILFYVAIAVVLLLTAFWRRQTLIGLFGALLWLGNRWSFYVARVAHTDFLALFFLVTSSVLIRRWYWFSLVLFSISLAVKQIGIFLVPLYLVYAWQRSTGSLQKRVLHLVGSGAVIGSVPFITALPFLLANPRAVLQAVFFSVARGGGADLGAPPLGTVLALSGTPRFFILLALIGLLAAAMWLYKLPLATATLLTFVVFLSFNTVLFNQYFVWMIPFVSLAAMDWHIPLYTKHSP